MAHNTHRRGIGTESEAGDWGQGQGQGSSLRFAGGRLYVMGRNTYGQLGLGDTWHRGTPQPLEAPNGQPITAVVTGGAQTAIFAGVAPAAVDLRSGGRRGSRAYAVPLPAGPRLRIPLSPHPHPPTTRGPDTLTWCGGMVGYPRCEQAGKRVQLCCVTHVCFNTSSTRL